MPSFSSFSIGKAALLYLPQKPVRTSVHSVFTHARNVVMRNGLLLTIAHSKAGHLPGGILLEPDHWQAFSSCPWEEGKLLWLSRISVDDPDHDFTLHWANAQVWEPKLNVRRFGESREILARMQVVIEPAEPCSIAKEELSRRSAALISALLKRNLDKTDEAVGALVGLGPGLTPSGDDILVGMMLALHLLRRHGDHVPSALRLLSSKVRQHAGRTTAVGESYLRYAAMGHFAEVAVNFGKQVLSAEGNWSAAADKLRDFGSSSGNDLMYGFAETVRAFGFN
ncbi:MAG: DUF2877 domain-containing protein [Thermodesulfobacteriota bacterium]|jgi:hypothetical protein